jgi:hypothetical protein
MNIMRMMGLSAVTLAEGKIMRILQSSLACAAALAASMSASYAGPC